jgi:hypothetical protein
MDQITKDEIEKLQFRESASNGNNALRTLWRMYPKAKEGKLILEVPNFAFFKEYGRSLRLNDDAERRLSAVAEQLLKDIIVVMRDTGMRNARELYCMGASEASSGAAAANLSSTARATTSAASPAAADDNQASA